MAVAGLVLLSYHTHYHRSIIDLLYTIISINMALTPWAMHL